MLGLFDSVNTIAIVDGYKYKFTLYYHNGTDKEYASIWYVGDTKCGKYQNYRIKFLNKQGSWSYWNFNKESMQTSTIERTEFKRPIQYDYTLDSTAGNYSTSGLRGQSILSSKVEQSFTLNTDWIRESDYQFLAQLFESPEVYIYFDNDDAKILSEQLGYSGTTIFNAGSSAAGTNIPIILTDSNYTFKTLNRDKLFNLTITYKYAFDTKIQNQ